MKAAPKLSAPAKLALQDLLTGKKCIPSEDVVRELGKAGLAYRRDLRSRARRLSLTAEGAKLIR